MDVFKEQEQLQDQASDFLASTKTLSLLRRLGAVTQTGSSVTGLMVYPDIDFAIHAEQRNFDDAVKLVPDIIAELSATALKIAHFKDEEGNTDGYYIGFEVPFNGQNWHIDATVGVPGPIITNPPELSGWLEAMSEDERRAILELKKELIEARRYMGSRSLPPHTFRSVHLYEAVLRGGARTIADLENYFT